MNLPPQQLQLLLGMVAVAPRHVRAAAEARVVPRDARHLWFHRPRQAQRPVRPCCRTRNVVKVVVKKVGASATIRKRKKTDTLVNHARQAQRAERNEADLDLPCCLWLKLFLILDALLVFIITDTEKGARPRGTE